MTASLVGQSLGSSKFHRAPWGGRASQSRGGAEEFQGAVAGRNVTEHGRAGRASRSSGGAREPPGAIEGPAASITEHSKVGSFR